MSYFTNKRVWITGASSGIGYAFALAVAKCSPSALILSGRDQDRLSALAALITSCPVLVLPFDVTDRSATLHAAGRIQTFCAGLDIAFFNAGGSEHVPISEFNAALYERAMALNYFSVMYGIEAALPLLKKSPAAHIVGMSSVASFIGIPQAESYCAAKAAVRLCLEGLRVQLRAEKICVTTVCPGFIKTPLIAKNDFYMPFLLSADKAACVLVRGIAKRKPEIIFPARMKWLIRLLQWLPKRIYTRLMGVVR